MKLLVPISILAILMINLVSPSYLSAQEGIGAGSFFALGADARALGMGGAFAAIPGDYCNAYWNPGGLAHLEVPQFGGMHSDIFGVGLSYNFVGGALPLSSLGNSAIRMPIVAATYLELATEVRAFDTNFEPLGLIRYSERLVSLSAAMSVPSLGSFGLTAKGYYFIAPGAGVDGGAARALGVGIDVGWLGYLWEDIWVGAVVKDVGDTIIQWRNTPTEPADRTLAKYAIGLSYIRDSYLLAADFNLQTEFPSTLRVGGEIKLGFLSLRAGAVANLEESVVFSAGVGIAVDKVNINVAWLQNKTIGDSEAHDTLFLSADFLIGQPGVSVTSGEQRTDDPIESPMEEAP